MKKELVIIIILATCLLGLGGFVVYDKFLKDEPATEENNNEQNGKDVDAINSDIEKRVMDLSVIEKFLDYGNFEFESNKNVLDDAYNRLDYVVLSFKDNYNSTSDEYGQLQSMAYVSYNDYQNKYNEIYGPLYNFEDDLNNSNGAIYDDCAEDYAELSNGNYICWMHPGITGTKTKMTINNKKFNDNIYTLDGIYNITSSNGTEKVKDGTFEIQYIIENNKEYLSSIIFNTTQTY